MDEIPSRTGTAEQAERSPLCGISWGKLTKFCWDAKSERAECITIVRNQIEEARSRGECHARLLTVLQEMEARP